jgi:hypothetical protein
VSYLSPTMTPRDLPKIILRLIYYVIYLLNSNYVNKVPFSGKGVSYSTK